MKVRIIGVIILFIISISALFVKTPQLEFYSNLSEKIPITIGYFFLISLFVERAIEIFLSAWRSEEADKKDLAIGQLKRKIESAISSGKQNLDSLSESLNILEHERINYSAKSRIYAIWTGIIIGACISLVGIRILGTIINASELNAVQSNLFTFVDMLLTATVLAGGSESINRLMKIYNSFTTSTTNRLK